MTGLLVYHYLNGDASNRNMSVCVCVCVRGHNTDNKMNRAFVIIVISFDCDSYHLGSACVCVCANKINNTMIRQHFCLFFFFTNDSHEHVSTQAQNNKA